MNKFAEIVGHIKIGIFIYFTFDQIYKILNIVYGCKKNTTEKILAVPLYQMNNMPSNAKEKWCFEETDAKSIMNDLNWL